MKIENIAKICHEANKAYCESFGDFSQPKWEESPEWQKQSYINGVMTLLSYPSKTPKELHDNWMEYKKKEGWKYGKEKNFKEKTHPCLVEYEDLPQDQKVKDYLFRAIVLALESLNE